MRSGQALVGSLTRFALTSTLDMQAYGLMVPFANITPTAFPVTDSLGNTYTTADSTAYTEAYTAQQRLNTLVQIVSLYGQPVILEQVAAPASGGSDYTLTFEVEHEGVIPDVIAFCVALNGIAGFIYSVASPGSNNVSLTLVSNLSSLQHLPGEVMAGDGFVS